MNTSVSVNSGEITRNGYYAILGGISFVCNLIVVLTIIRQKELRQRRQYIVVCALAIARALSGSGYIGAGLYRIQLYKNNEQYRSVTSLYCMTRYHNLIWVFSYPLTEIMLFVVAVDRLIISGNPIRYINSKKGTFLILSLCYGFCMLLLLYVFAVNTGRSRYGIEPQALCYLFFSLQNARIVQFLIYQGGMALVFLSFFIYIFALILHFNKKNVFTARTVQIGGYPQGQPAYLGAGQTVPVYQNVGQPIPLGQNMGQQVPIYQNMGQPIPLGQNMGQQVPIYQNMGQVPLGQNMGQPVPVYQNSGIAGYPTMAVGQQTPGYYVPPNQMNPPQMGYPSPAGHQSAPPEYQATLVASGSAATCPPASPPGYMEDEPKKGETAKAAPDATREENEKRVPQAPQETTPAPQQLIVQNLQQNQLTVGQPQISTEQQRQQFEISLERKMTVSMGWIILFTSIARASTQFVTMFYMFGSLFFLIVIPALLEMASDGSILLVLWLINKEFRDGLKFRQMPQLFKPK